MSRVFEDKPAVRVAVPLLVGLMGPSGGGKTMSALEIATGIQEIVGGDIYALDTESNRMLAYAEYYKFRHVSFKAPFGSLDYLEAMQHCVNKGAKIVITDSLSHEHEGPGGMLDFWEKEQDRMAGEDWQKRERIKMLAIQKPKQHRRRLINTMLQMDCNFISCFRAKETAKPMKVRQENGSVKTEVVQLGFMPIAGDEFVFEQTLNCLLLPNAKGYPSWHSDNQGEEMMIKMPRQFEHMFQKPRQLDRQVGRELAEWARGTAVKPEPQVDVQSLTDIGDEKAKLGVEELKKWWVSIGARSQNLLKDRLPGWKTTSESKTTAA